MDCKEFKSYIPAFFEDNLEVGVAEEFIKHATECKECAEEMEIMHLLQVGLKELDGEGSDEVESYDFRRILKDKLAMLEKRCVKIRNFNNLHRAVIVMTNLATFIGIGFWLFMRFGGTAWLADYF